MQTDVKSAYSTSSAALVAYRTRIRAIHICVNTAGTSPVIIYDNATTNSGNILAQFGANSAGHISLIFPGEGVLAYNGVYASIGSAYSVTVFYG